MSETKKAVNNPPKWEVVEEILGKCKLVSRDEIEVKLAASEFANASHVDGAVLGIIVPENSKMGTIPITMNWNRDKQESRLFISCTNIETAITPAGEYVEGGKKMGTAEALLKAEKVVSVWDGKANLRWKRKPIQLTTKEGIIISEEQMMTLRSYFEDLFKAELSVKVKTSTASTESFTQSKITVPKPEGLDFNF